MTMCPHNDDTPEKYSSQDTRNKLSEDEPGRQVVQQKHQADLRQRQVEGLGIFKIRWKKFFSKSGRQETGALGDKFFQIKCGLLLLLSIVKMNYLHFSYIDILLLYTSQYREWGSSSCQPVKNII